MKHQRPRYVVGDRFEATIERIVPGGAGLARGSKGIVFVDGAVPGDRATIEIEPSRGGVPRGRIVSLGRPGPDRVAPACRWYGECGGCDFQHLSYPAQLEAKRAIVADAFRRLGGIELPESTAVFAAPRPLGSRARVELHTGEEREDVGFFAPRSIRVVPIDRCLVARDEINQAIERLRAMDRKLPPSIQLLAGEGRAHAYPEMPTLPGEPFWARIGDFDYLIDPGAFFQSSFDLLPQMIDVVVASAGDERGVVWDLFGGAGLFSLPLARHASEVVGVDVDPRAIENARRSAQRNDVGNARFVAADVTRWLADRKRRTATPSLVVVDPPRAGLGKQLAQMLLERNLPKLTYVSCDPATLARDLKILTSGRLGVERVWLFDLFPQTHHVETIVHLSMRR
ncbi:MAG: class I SAM-dependent RNA methyltransferase [Thermomicrobiales bacterium]|nr:class I SAM-dependent RNA methyltransferase [Thermomicrobiales bacterium]